jgi:hypothetical protein
VLAKLEADAGLMSVPSAKAGLEDMRLLLEYLEVYGVLDKVSPGLLPHATSSRRRCRSTCRSRAD